MEKLKVGNRFISISHSDKIIFPDAKITKQELIEYYFNIAKVMIPLMKNHPLTMQRFVDGIEKEGFYQKNASDYFPEWIKRVSIAKQDDGKVNYVICNNAATLVYLANQLALTFHLWLSRSDKLNYPDKMIFDLDPSVSGFTPIRVAAKKLKAVLENELSFKTFLMTTGSRGVHVVVPLARKDDFDFVRSFARDVGQLLAARHSNELTIDVRKTKRGKRIFVDFLRNAFAQTGVAPYSIRPKPGAPIATPIEWEELSFVTPQKFTIKNISKRLDKKECPWKYFGKQTFSLKKARKKLDILLKNEELL